MNGLSGMLGRMIPGDSRTAEEEPALLARARDGDDGAFEAIVSRHLPQVWRAVWRIVRNDADCEDVVQEVFLAAHRSLAGFRGDSALSTWLYRIAVTRALNHVQRAGERASRASVPLEGFPDLAGGSATPLQALEAQELQRRLTRCLDRLPAAWRAVLALREGEGLDYAAIAAALELALGTVRSRLARARSALRDCLEGEAA